MRAVRAVFLLLATVALGACATTPKDQVETGVTAADGSFDIPLVVENDISGGSSMSIYVQLDTGAGRRLLGSIEPGQRRTFQVPAREGTIQLVARGSAGERDRLSESFVAYTGMTLQWFLNTNQLLKGTKK